MNATTRESEIRFFVPKGLDPEPYSLWGTNKVGSASKTFTIEALILKVTIGRGGNLKNLSPLFCVPDMKDEAVTLSLPLFKVYLLTPERLSETLQHFLPEPNDLQILQKSVYS